MCISVEVFSIFLDEMTQRKQKYTTQSIRLKYNNNIIGKKNSRF